MKEFYVMNLDMRRIAIIAGGALTVLGLALFIGMAIGRGQGERNARIATEENQQQKLGLPASESADPLVMASGPTSTGDAEAASMPVKNRQKPVEKFSSLEKTQAPVVPSVPEASSEVPLREDPLVAGPPRKKASAKKNHKVAKAETGEDEVSEKPRKKKSVAKAKRSEREEPEISGRVEHAKAKRKKRVVEADDDQLASVAGTASAQRAASARYTIQVAAFKRSSEAHGLIEKLKEEGIKAHSEKNGDFYLVTVGRTKSKGKLEKALSRLKELEYDAYIRKLSSPSDET
jgi:cell division protein FtsN